MHMTAHKSARKRRKGKSIKQQKMEDARAKKLQEARPERNLPYAGPVVRDTVIGRLKLTNG